MGKMKVFSVLLVLCLTALLVSACSLFGSSGSSSRAVKADPKGTVVKAYQKLSTLKSYHMAEDTVTSLTMDGKNSSIMQKAEADVQLNPLIMKSTMTVNTRYGSQESKDGIIAYGEESGDRIKVYMSAPGSSKWEKDSQAKNDFSPTKDFDGYIKAITSATLKSEDNNAYVFEVVASGAALQEQIRERVNSTNVQVVAIKDEYLKGLGDLTYTVTVDKKTETISKIDIDLSGFAAKIGNNIANDKAVSDSDKRAVKERYSSMKLKSVITFSQYNSVGNISIPAEAKQ